MSIFDKHEDGGKLVLRLMVGVLLLLHGIGKMKAGVDWITPMLAGVGLPGFIRYGAYVGEVVAPVLLIIGLFTRPAGLVVAFHMLVAVLLARRADIGTLTQSGGWAIELEALYALGGFAIYCLGSGKYSISRGKGIWN